MACCSSCALGDLDAALPKREGSMQTAALVLAFSALALAGLLHYAPEKKRVRRRYTDPGIRQTRELPIESNREVVYQRRR
jgi:hypothetical protein